MKKIEPLPNKGNQSIIDLIAILGNKSNEHTLAINSLIEEVEGIKKNYEVYKGSGLAQLEKGSREGAFNSSPKPDVREKVAKTIYKHYSYPYSHMEPAYELADEILAIVKEQP